MKLILSAILIASLGLSTLADASAIKGGHARPNEEAQARSIKLAAPGQTFEKTGSKQVPAAPVAILESTKRIYNDESIRRLVQAAPPQPEQVVKVEEPVVPVQKESVVPQQAPVVSQPVSKPVVEQPAAPVVPVVPQQAPAAPEQAQPVVVVQPQAPVVPAAVEPKSAAPVVAKSEELPPQSERSAQAPASVVVVEQVVKAQEQAAPLSQPEVVQPVVPVVQPVVVPAAQPVVAAPAQPVVVPVAQPAVAQPVQPEESQLQAKKDEPAELPIEVPAPDPQLMLSEPIDSTTKLLIDLDEHVQKFLPAEEQHQAAQPPKDQVLVPGVDYSPPAAAPSNPTGKSSGPLVPYASVSATDDAIVPPLPSLDGVEKASAAQPAAASSVASAPSSSSAVSSPSATRQGGQHQNQQQVIVQLIDQLDSLQNRIQDTINQLVARRRYVMSALLRPMGTYVRRVRSNLERLQNRVNSLQAAAVSVGGGQNRPGGFVDAAAIETIRKRIDDISKRISDIVNRIRFSLTPTSAPMNSNGRK